MSAQFLLGYSAGKNYSTTAYAEQKRLKVLTSADYIDGTVYTAIFFFCIGLVVIITKLYKAYCNEKAKEILATIAVGVAVVLTVFAFIMSLIQGSGFN